MRVMLYAVPEPPGGGPIPAQPLRECPVIAEVEPGPGWTVTQVLEAGGADGGFERYRFFTAATPALEADVSTDDIELAQFLNLFGVDQDGHLRFNDHNELLKWNDFVSAFDEQLYEGDPTRLAVYQQGVAGGPEPEFLQQLVDFLLSGVPQAISGAVAGAIAAKAVHPKQLIDDVKKKYRLHTAERLRRRNFTGPRLLSVCKRYEEWDPKRLERLHEFTEAEAIRVLLNAGYVPGEGGFWTKSKTVEGKARRQAMEQVQTDAWEQFKI